MPRCSRRCRSCAAWHGWGAPWLLVVACGGAGFGPWEGDGAAAAPPTCTGTQSSPEANAPDLLRQTQPATPLEALDAAAGERFAGLALACIHREYPNKIAHVLASDDDIGSPRALTPAFFGCFDWHSAVHGHWLLVRLLRLDPQASFADRARAALQQSFTPSNVAGELAYLGRADRVGFERPYGLAWLLQLTAELRQWDDPDARRWAETLAPLEALAAEHLGQWLAKLSHPIRSGEHSQTGFALGVALDWARSVGHEAFASQIAETARNFHDGDRGCSLGLEPSGHDFLSPCLGAADLMRRVHAPEAFARWLDVALPGIPTDGSTDWLEPATPPDRADGKLAHLDGLNLSRAWMLEGIAAGLPSTDGRQASLRAAARVHASAGLAAVSGEHYAGGHWLGSFAVYLTTRRGLTSDVAERQ